MLFAYIFILVNFLFCGDVSVNVDRYKINEGDSITLTVQSKNSNNAPIVSLSNFEDFTVISGPNQSSNSSYSIINGKMTSHSTITLTWVLMPRKIGKLFIPSFEIEDDGKIIKSKPIYVNVVKRSKNSKKNAQFFIEADIDNELPYRGEQIILTYTLYTRVDVTSFDEKIPRYKNFWVEELFSPQKLDSRVPYFRDVNFNPFPATG